LKDPDTYLQVTLSGQRRRGLERRRRRLVEAGRLEFAALGPGDDAASWADAFLACEAAGWKGHQGTALACSEADRCFFRAVLTAAHARGRLMALALHLDGRPIALRCSLLSCGGAFAFKTTYDEALAGYSPGVLLELETIRRLHLQRPVDWMDSCAAGDNELLNALWQDRRHLQTLLAATGRFPGGLVVSVLPALRRLKNTFLPAKEALP
jgi:CelD/BcsL family acetyltransferase involved in cellulose biosynthesis